MKKTIVLIILDGFGIGKNDQSNPIFAANTQNFNYIKANFPSACLQASGIAVGLPWEEEGNSEVGHLTIGAGRVVYQNYPLISTAIREGFFFKNEIIKKTFEHAKKNNSSVNFIGLLTDGNIHASLEHLKALLKFSQQENFNKINLHLILDGRDSAPTSSIELLQRLNDIESYKPKYLATISGRYYAMDRDKHWERTRQYYQIITNDNSAVLSENIADYIKKTHNKKLSDEYVPPAILSNEKIIKNNDALFFFNFREDRMRQITEAFINKNFNQFPIKNFSNLYVATMTNYYDDLRNPVAFTKEIVSNPLSKVLSDNGKIQFKIAETEKYAHITYFFNGKIEQPFNNEYRVLIPSRIKTHYDEHPEMMADEITQRVIEAISEQIYDFILANYANTDIIGHTGNYNAALKSVEIIDKQIGKIITACLEQDAILIITSDHGNVEVMFNERTGESETKHNSSPVPIYLVAKEFKLSQPKSPMEIIKAERNNIGVLSDIAPTILELMKIPKPKEMTGQSLINYLIT